MRFFKQAGKYAAGGAALVTGAAHAAIPTNVSDALSTGLTDATGVAALALIIVVGIAVFKYMRRGL
jgi:hypothetical protein